jgi:hypothetical protein
MRLDDRWVADALRGRRGVAPNDDVSSFSQASGGGTREVGEFASLLDEVAVFVRRYVVLTEAQAWTVALWVAHTWTFDAVETTPYLAISSAEKRSGKTLLLDVLELLVCGPWRAVTPTEAAVFRKIEADRPTLLLDEYDTIFNPRRDGTTEGLRAILNAGYRAGTPVARCVGEGSRMHVRDFQVFCPKALAGIGELPDTVRDRSIVLRLRRRAPDESVACFRRRDAAAAAAPLHEALEAFATPEVIAVLRDARPCLPDGLDDRAADGWEPLVAIADLASGTWPARARAAAVELSTGEQREDDSIGVRLLADIRRVFDDKRVDRLATAQLIQALCADKEAPWDGWSHGKPLTPRPLARLLVQYGVRSRTIRLDDSHTPKGYHRDQFEDAWSRYLPLLPAVDAPHPPQPAPAQGLRPIEHPPYPPRVADRHEGGDLREHPLVADVADSGGRTGEGKELQALRNQDAFGSTSVDDERYDELSREWAVLSEFETTFDAEEVIPAPGDHWFVDWISSPRHRGAITDGELRERLHTHQLVTAKG